MMQMEGHPPLCPKTEDTFFPLEDDLGTDDPHIHVVAGADCLRLFPNDPWQRRLVARYQTCAWMDRAERWYKVNRYFLEKYGWDQYGVTHWLSQESNELCIECEQNAEKWRQWERDAKRSE
jgi:hypothetical protein